MSPAAGVAPLAPWRERWQGLAPRERLLATIAIAVVALLLVWLIALQPALRVVRQAPAELDRLEAQLQAMQRLAAEARELRDVAPVSAAQASAALRSATERLGERARLTVQGDRATVTFNAVTGEALRGWLADARSAARAQPVEAQLSRSGNGYSGTLILALAGGS